MVAADGMPTSTTSRRFIALGNLVRDARERALDGGGVEDDGGFRHKKKIANRSAGRGDSRYAFCVHFSFATSQGGVKGTKTVSSICRGGGLAVFAPGRAVLDDPIRQRLLEADVAPGFSDSIHLCRRISSRSA
jgi:hypothetical protein